jgi:hypothetical protein
MKQEHLHKRRGDERVASDTFVTNVQKANSDGRSPKRFLDVNVAAMASVCISLRQGCNHESVSSLLFLTHD